MPEAMRLITVKEVLKITGYRSRTTLWRRVKAGSFPKPIALSEKATRWNKAEVEAWVEALPTLSYAKDGVLDS